MTCMYCAHAMYVSCTCYACVMHVLGEWNTHAMHVLCACYAYAMHVLYRAATGSYAHRVRLPPVTARGGAAPRASPGCHKQLGAAHAVATRHGALWAGPRTSPGCNTQLCASMSRSSHVHGKCIARSWHVHGACMARAWHVHGACLARAWRVLGTCMARA